MGIPISIQAGIWGLVSGAALIIGAAIGYGTNISARTIAGIMAFGSGVLISAISFDLMDEAYQRGGFDSTGLGFVLGAAVYTAANVYLSRRGAKHRKRSQGQQPTEPEQEGSGLAIAFGALLDGIPESIVIGVSMIESSRVSIAAVVAIFLSNLPEGLSSAAGMKKAKRSLTYVFGLWTGITVILGFAAFLGYALFSTLSPEIIAATTAIAAGAILAMLSDTMIPEAFEATHDFSGLVTVLGFLSAFVLTKWGK